MNQNAGSSLTRVKWSLSIDPDEILIGFFQRLNISRNGGMNSRRVIELLSSCPRLTSIDVSFCFAVDIQELVGSRTARDILTNKTGFELHIEGCNWTKESVVAFSIIYPKVQLYAGNNIYVQSAKEFLARINFANIAM